MTVLRGIIFGQCLEIGFSGGNNNKFRPKNLISSIHTIS